ncbi:MAG: hypothetical protein LBF16_14645 [Pseudomonadales bacterium]|nr:hypothetical protein [Pseudomonadales bacterium]
MNDSTNFLTGTRKNYVSEIENMLRRLGPYKDEESKDMAAHILGSVISLPETLASVFTNDKKHASATETIGEAVLQTLEKASAGGVTFNEVSNAISSCLQSIDKKKFDNEIKNFCTLMTALSLNHLSLAIRTDVHGNEKEPWQIAAWSKIAVANSLLGMVFGAAYADTVHRDHKKKGARKSHASDYARRDVVRAAYKAGEFKNKNKAAEELSQMLGIPYETVRDYLKNT